MTVLRWLCLALSWLDSRVMILSCHLWNCICTWTLNDFTIDINVRTNWLWPPFACSLYFLSQFDLMQLCKVFGDLVHLYIQSMRGLWFTWIRISMRDISIIVLTCFQILRPYKEIKCNVKPMWIVENHFNTVNVRMWVNSVQHHTLMGFSVHVKVRCNTISASLKSCMRRLLLLK